MTQKRANNKSNSDKYSPMEDSGAGFRMVPPSGDHVCSRAGSTMHPGVYGNSRNRKHDDHQNLPSRSISNLKTANGGQLRSQVSYMPQYAGDLSVFAGASRAGSAASQHVLDRPASSHKKDGGGKDSTMVCYIFLLICFHIKISNKVVQHIYNDSALHIHLIVEFSLEEIIGIYK